MNYKDFFKNDKVLVTGASGLVGRNLYELLKSHDVNVVGTFYSKYIKDLIYCDLTDNENVDKIMEDVDYVFMIAAKTYGAEVLANNPAAMVKDTILMNNNILESALKYKVKKLLYISSSVVYQESFKPLAEEDLDWNKNPYSMYMGVGWVKRYLEKLCEFYSTLGLNINIVRPANIYGKYDKYQEGKSHFIPAITKRILEEQDPLIIWGDGYQIKDITYVDDFLRDMLLVFMNYNHIDAINICSGQYYTVKKIVNELLNIINPNIHQIIYDTSKPGSVPYKTLIKNKFNTLFGIQEYTSLNKGLTIMVEWLRKELKHE